ncbi:uncharacterized protein MELLADRAFT_73438 [Melampsora larici-populina 98AG31]|uniref:Uncharacterized protein n=1 Tax=Melampsora larici-populina (strain 98AG31 / pathotype 3-4-7) TaxID=747676 RepID=F4S872_MELLP|nr:uncharacterized protein MELLADRAFT_73438 [Melampsora larici-populina 98AG31]EGF99136.1 hypothetical protein MELLADRAFT_73438 [Melampsora larici-populina 98AG31]
MDFESEEDCLAFKPEDNQFLLPALTHLTIWPSAGCQYIHCFSGCKALRHIMFNYFIGYDSAPDKKSNYMLEEGSFEGLLQFSNFITRNHFPKLKVIHLPVEEESLPLDAAVVSILIPLDEYCKSIGIQLKIFFDRVSHSTFSSRDYQPVPLQKLN